MNINRATVQFKKAELETAKSAVSKAEGQVFLAEQQLKEAKKKVETLTKLVEGVKLGVAELEYKETGCRTPSLHWQLDNSDCVCKTTYFLTSAKNWFDKGTLIA